MPTSRSASIPSKVQDFTVLPIQFPPQPSYPHAATHYLYLRADSPKTADDRTEDTPRSVFVANIPIDSTESSFRKLFKELCGARVERVDFDGELKKPVLGISGEAIVQGTQVAVPIEVKRGKKRKRGNSIAAAEDEAVKKALAEMELPRTWERDVWESGSSAVVVFVDQATRDLALKEARRMVKRGVMLEWPTSGELGEKRYRAHHSLTYPSRSLLQSRVNNYLTHFTKLEAARSKLLARQRQVPDEDGFVTVTRGGRAGPARLEEAQAAAERLKEREKKRIGGDFYRFQTREGRKARERELKQKFEEDKRRIQDMKQRRGRIRPE